MLHRSSGTEPQQRVIIIGASNVARGITSLIDCCHATWGMPTSFHIAAGHGRSLGHGSRFLGRRLPPVLDCDLWSDLRTLPTQPTAALLTDLGGDLIFGATPGHVLENVEACLTQLQRFAQRIVITRIPLESLSKLAPERYLRLRKKLFPSSRLELLAALEGVEEINERLAAFAGTFGCYVVSPEVDWYGKDPVHVRSSHFATAWHRYLSPWSDFCHSHATTHNGSNVTNCLWYWRLRPKHVTWLGFNCGKAQPFRQSRVGSVFWSY